MKDVCIGIDIGTEEIKFVSTEVQKTGGKARILEYTSFPARGFSAGSIIDKDSARKAISQSFQKFISSHGEKINPVSINLALGGKPLSFYAIKFKRTIPNEEIFSHDLETLIARATEQFEERYPNKSLLHTFRLASYVDGEFIQGNPIGMFANLLEMKLAFLAYQGQQYSLYLEIFKEAKIDIHNIVALPIAEAEAVLNYRQKMQGVCLVNIGAETTSIATFQNGLIQSLSIHPIGSNHITNDIALAFQIPLGEAEKVKLGKSDFPKRKVESVISARLEDIVDILKKELKEGRRMKYLPAGIVLTGGGSEISFIESFLKERLLFPVEKGEIAQIRGKKRDSKLSLFVAAYGSCVFHREEERRAFSFNIKKLPLYLKKFIRQIRP